MIIGRDAIISHPLCGMPAAHLQGIVNASKKHNVVIGMRSVSPLAKHWIEAGYPTKSFVIKNKTGRMGPCQGLIAIDPAMGRTSEFSSRVETPSTSRDDYDLALPTHPSVESLHQKYRAQLQDALTKDKTLKPIPLILSQSDLDALQAVTVIPKPDFEGDYQLVWYDEAAQVRVADAYYESGNYKIVDIEGEPIRVLGQEIINAEGQHELRPVTADYDLLVVCPTFKDFSPGLGQKDHTPLRTQSLNSAAFKKSLNETLERPESPQEDPKGGNWSGRIREVVSTINHEIAVMDQDKRSEQTQGLDMVHHNAEFTNPFASSLRSSLPATLVLPEPIDLSRFSNIEGIRSDCVLVETPEELTQLREHLWNQGYYWPANVNLNAEVPVFPEDKVAPVRDHISRQLSQKSLLQTLQGDPKQPHSGDDTPDSDNSTSGIDRGY